MNLPLITSSLFAFVGYILLFYMLAVIFVYTMMLIIAFIRLTKERKLQKNLTDEEAVDFIYTQPVTVIVPAYNEQVGVLGNIYSLLALEYPEFEILVVNDGSTDETEALVIKQFDMKPLKKVIHQQLDTKPIQAIYQSEIHPNLRLITKENGGKADALNAGINVSKYPYFCSVDGDSMLDRTSLLRVMKPIMESNKEVVATGGNVRIANGYDIQMGQMVREGLPISNIIKMQIVEYMRAFLMGRIALSRFNLVLIISGAFSVFTKKFVLEVGGYSTKTVGEDMELVVKLHKAIGDSDENKEIVFTADPICWTEAPDTLADLRTQRRRWHQGLAESLWLHKTMAFNPRYGLVGLVSYPYFLLLELLGPLIELVGYVYLIISLFMGEVYIMFAGLLGLTFLLYGSLFSMASVLLEAWSRNTFPKIEELISLVLLSLTEVFWYRPLTIIWRVEGIVRALRGKREWGQIKRRGLSEDSE
ncbi:glycosyltransferase [Sporosarcina sp. GW1-11]|uniref:glycosyltransferase family 2 protein n=1 Tax=Sporosarcina sp. GW1-11 TaxID=2899126 RepID=UPI00294E236A|nr:glycosyltransferase [Sporosarcina sp. GW1-11]MDV6378306.1 glycosyltransferase [Sporosarcina sp. GW1-11]